MADVILCVNSDCEVKDSCYRYCAKPGILPSYINFGYTCNLESGFQEYIKMKGSEE